MSHDFSAYCFEPGEFFLKARFDGSVVMMPGVVVPGVVFCFGRSATPVRSSLGGSEVSDVVAFGWPALGRVEKDEDLEPSCATFV